MTTPRPLILPTSDPDSPPSTILSLPHPRTAIPTRFLLHPSKGLYEITKVASPGHRPRSWLLTPARASTTASASTSTPASSSEEQSTPWVGDGQVIRDDALYVSTPIDPVFLLLPRLLPATESNAHFLPVDDLLDSLFGGNDDEERGEEADADKAKEKKVHWEPVLKQGGVARRHVEARIRAVCESVDVGDEKAYRVSKEKVLRVLARKCETMAAGGLPKSMEDEFVVKPLVRPAGMEAVAEDAATKEIKKESEETGAKENAKDEGTPTSRSENKSPQLPNPQLPTPPESQTEDSAAPTPAPAPPPLPKPTTLPPPSDAALHLLRLRVASQFLCATYLPPHISALLQEHLSSTHNFAPLDTYLAELKRLRTEAAMMRVGDFSRKRALGEDEDEAGDSRAEKKRKREEEEKRKRKSVSKGVRELSKVNTRGMAKMTSFFKKKE